VGAGNRSRVIDEWGDGRSLRWTWKAWAGEFLIRFGQACQDIRFSPQASGVPDHGRKGET